MNLILCSLNCKHQKDGYCCLDERDEKKEENKNDKNGKSH